MDWSGWKRYALVGTLVVVVFVVFAVLYGQLPWWIDGPRLRALRPQDQAGILSSDRGDVLKMVAGAGALVALVYTARKHTLDRAAHVLDRQAYLLSEQGQVTDRYTKAITQLASDRLSERIGGIYALERVMADSERDHTTVVEVLAAFVREHSPRDPMAGDEQKLPLADVRAAMTVLARRPQRVEPFAVDLRRTALVGIELPHARFERANFEGADLSGARFTSAKLTHALLAGADLRGVYFFHAQLDVADLKDADLEGAILDQANLAHANLRGARLASAGAVGADFRNAIMSGADFGRASMSNAVLTRAHASGSHMVETDLTGADLTGANLSNAELIRATLASANLSHAVLLKANLTYASLSGADLTAALLPGALLNGVAGLVPAQLSAALLSDTTAFDDELANDAWVQARIAACTNGKVPLPQPTPEPSAA